jgi:hypothetical protein
MSQNLQKIAEFQKIQLDNLEDFEKCSKTHIFLQKSEPIQPKRATFCRNFANRRSRVKKCLKLLRGKTIGASVILLEIRLCNVKPKPMHRKG